MDSNFLRYINHRLPAVFLSPCGDGIAAILFQLDCSAILDLDLRSNVSDVAHKFRFSFTSMATLRSQ